MAKSAIAEKGHLWMETSYNPSRSAVQLNSVISSVSHRKKYSTWRVREIVTFIM